MTTQSRPHHHDTSFDTGADINPGLRQAAAADPHKSVWVGASAGTGKTKVLIDRLLRLMLPRPGQSADTASRPEKIVCLTFTKTAAAEMSNRIFEKLSAWAVMDDMDLRRDLFALTGADDDLMLREARRLFARVLDAPGGLKIMTIHSFCQSILKRFPVEAGLAPHFELMDEQSALEYLTSCLHDIIAESRAGRAPDLARAFSTLALYEDAAGMSALMSKMMSKRSLLADIFERHGDSAGSATHTITAMRKTFGLDPLPEGVTENVDDILSALVNPAPDAERDLRRALAALLQGSSDDRSAAALIEPWLAAPAHRVSLYPEYRLAFYTKDDGGKSKIRSRLATKSAEKFCADIVDIMTREAERIGRIDEKMRAVKLAEINAALLRLAAEVLERYARYKAETDRLDYEDLIIRTARLLDGRGMVEWVLFKMDEGIDHMLVDEAQDTSPQQWNIVRALADEFFSGQGRTDNKTRTLFVVGDEKQSIFSFQGADPAAFDRMQRYFGARAADIQEGWEILLQYSFRSTHTVLDLVDRVFAAPDVRRGVVADITRSVRHIAFRKGHAGLVELWPLVQTEQGSPEAPWRIPTDIDAGDDAAARLAGRIAKTVSGWIKNGEILPSQGRPIKPSDIMILVQTRSAIVELLMRALKAEGVPVAGVDRLKLKKEIAVMDLLAVAAFALQPRDDLTLATVLKSPLVGLNEDALFKLCHDRRATLWARVQSEYPAIADYLYRFIERSGYATPYEFFAGALYRPCPADAVSGRRALFSRLGIDIQDALDEFLNGTLHFEQTHTPSLQRFVDWFGRGEADVKREQEAAGLDQVRIMTVHASKGLQAPIVFLPDTVKIIHDHNKGRQRLLWPDTQDLAQPESVPLWSPRQEFDAAAYARRQSAAAAAQMEEYRRLLYVALTRAEDRLYICGYQGKRAPKPDCWYTLVSDAFPAEAEQIPCDDIRDAKSGAVLYARRLAHPQTVPAKTPVTSHAADVAADDAVRLPLPVWTAAVPDAEPVPPKPLAPARPDEEEPAVEGPLAAIDNKRFRRGIIVHHLLEWLPRLPAPHWQKHIAAYLARPSLDLTPALQQRFADELMQVLTHPDFAPIFAAGSAAEVPVTGVIESRKGGAPFVLSGQIDRLRVTETEVLIVDFKTNRPPPAEAADVAPVYLRQLAGYRAVLRQIYPAHNIKCALLWTDVPRLMPVADDLLDPYAP